MNNIMFDFIGEGIGGPIGLWRMIERLYAIGVHWTCRVQSLPLYNR